MENFTTQANPAQLEAITTTEGPLLIIAGPGSGKTFTLVERTVYLITQKGAMPESLFIATFTEKAAHELVTRISNRLNALGIRFNLNEMYCGTFHSICLRWLQDYRELTRLKHNFTMMDQFDQQYFVYRRIWDYQAIPGIEHLTGKAKSTWWQTNALVPWLNLVSEEALDPAVLAGAPEEEVRALGAAYQLYQSQLLDANALDFSTIQYETLRLLRAHPDILAELQQKIHYFMVDEYQDTNTIQELLLKHLTGLTPNQHPVNPENLVHPVQSSSPASALDVPHHKHPVNLENPVHPVKNPPNLAVVGDEDQGLYRFRGATIRNILQFKDNFPPGQCAQVTLSTNYRSHKDIIAFYGQWMSDQSWTHMGQTFRYRKTIAPPEGRAFPPVPGVIRLMGAGEDHWHEEVLAFLHALRDRGDLKDWNQVAFLFKSVKHQRVGHLAQYLEDHGIPVYAPRANQFFQREEIRLMLGAFLTLFPQFIHIRKWKEDADLEIWRYYDEMCGRFFLQQMRRPENAELFAWVVRLGKDHMTLSANANYAFSGLFYQLLQFPLFSRYLDEERLHGGFEDRRPMYNLALFSQLLGKFEHLHHIDVLTPQYLDRNLRDLFNQFFNYLKDGGINEYEDESEYAPSGCVSFLTIHQSKGLEFPVVLVGALHAGPRKSHKPLDEILQTRYYARPPYEPFSKTKYYDFRRLYYTAFSRAQNLLVLTDAERDSAQGVAPIPSKHFRPYVDDLPSWHDPSFDPVALPLVPVKDVNIKQQYSFTSHIALFENCAEQYRFFRELEFAPVRTAALLFGTLVHQTIEDIHRAVLRGEAHTLSESRIHGWFDLNYATLSQRDHVYLAPAQRRAAMRHVLGYYRRYGGDGADGDWSHLLEAEVDVSLVKDDYILKGTVDLILGEGGQVDLVDFKSDSRKPDVNDLDDRERLSRYCRQLEVYAHLVEERTGQDVRNTSLYYTAEGDGNPYITWSKNPQAIEKTIATFDTIVKRIEDRDFAIPARPTKLCENCDMRYYCDRKNWHFLK